MVHYCHICNNYKHPLHCCSVLKQPRPTASLGGCGLVNAMFVQLPDSLFKENLAPPTLPTALVTISGGSLSSSVVEAEVAKIAAVQTSWKWEAMPHGANAFLVSFPSVEILQRVAAFEYNVKSHDVKITFSEWKIEEVPSLLPLQPVWVHVTGVPPALRHFLGLWAVGSVIGATQDVDLVCLRRHGIVRIQVAVHNMDIFVKHDGSDESSVSSDVYVKLNGYAFRFVLEEGDFVPDDDFIPRIWENHDDGHDDGANRDEDMPDRDASKRAKKDQMNGGNTTCGAQSVSTVVPMQTTYLGFQHATVPPQVNLLHNPVQDVAAKVDVSATFLVPTASAQALATSNAPTAQGATHMHVQVETMQPQDVHDVAARMQPAVAAATGPSAGACTPIKPQVGVPPVLGAAAGRP